MVRVAEPAHQGVYEEANVVRLDQIRPAAAEAPPQDEFERLRHECHSQAARIELLARDVATLRRRSRSLKAENLDLLAENARLRVAHQRHERVKGAQLADVALPARSAGARPGTDGRHSVPRRPRRLARARERAVDRVRDGHEQRASQQRSGRQRPRRPRAPMAGKVPARGRGPGAQGSDRAEGSRPRCGRRDGPVSGADAQRALGVIRTPTEPTRVWAQLPCDRAVA